MLKAYMLHCLLLLVHYVGLARVLYDPAVLGGLFLLFLVFLSHPSFSLPLRASSAHAGPLKV